MLCDICYRRLVEAQSTPSYNTTTLYNNHAMGRTRGIDYTLKTYKPEALVIPSNGHSHTAGKGLGYTSTPVTLAGYPIISGENSVTREYTT